MMSVQSWPNQQTEPRLQHVCAGCLRPIADKILLDALDRYWHMACLKCSCCGGRLAELGPSLFVKSDMLLCRQDYIKLFGSGGTCLGCKMRIAPDEMVMRVQGEDRVFHVKCFKCTHCRAPLHPGDQYLFLNGEVYCQAEFARLQKSPLNAVTNRTSWSGSKHDSPPEEISTPPAGYWVNSVGDRFSPASSSSCGELSLASSSTTSRKNSTVSFTSTGPPTGKTGRGKQKKVDARRMAPLQVC